MLVGLVLVATALPWLSDPGAVVAQDEAATEAEPVAEPTAEPQPTQDSTHARGLMLPAGGQIAVIEIEGALFYENQAVSIKRRIERASAAGVDLIVFEFNTPGGRVDLALDLSQEIRRTQVPTVAWVNDQALSAGILLASACDELVMAPGSLTGDCAPIVPGMDLAPTERAKQLSPLLAEFRANAQSNYAGTTTNDYALFHAMCVLGVDVYQVRNTATGEVRLVSQPDYEVMVNGVAPIDAGQVSAPTSNSAFDAPMDIDEVARPTVTVTSSADVGAWELVKQVHNGSTLVTLNETEALDLGLSRATIGSEADLSNLYSGAAVMRYSETWSESLVGFLLHPIVRGCLLVVGILGILIEAFSPGLFLPGIIGIAAILTLIVTPFLVGLAQVWHLGLIIIGIGLVVYELLTLTTFGAFAVLGLLMFLTGLVLSGVQTLPNGMPAPGSAGRLITTTVSFIVALIAFIPLMFVLNRFFGSLPLFSKLIHNETLPASLASNGEGGPARPYEHVSGDESVGAGSIQQGMTGTVTRTGLRPGGRIEIQGQIIDVTSTGSFVEPGTRVRVTEVHGNLIVVESDEEG